MNITIISATMTQNKEDGYLGHVVFQAEGHKHAYEITLQSDKGKDWNYALNFAEESGSEEEITAVEQVIESDDDMFDMLLDAAAESLEKSEEQS
jgi:hypothetical protein